LFLTIWGMEPGGMVRLNGETLGDVWGHGRGAAWDITDWIARRNELQIAVPELADDKLGGIFGEVALEVRASDWIESLALEVTGEPGAEALWIAVNVAGIATDRPLELLLRCDGRDAGALDVSRGPFCAPLPVSGMAAWEPGKKAQRMTEFEVRLLQGGSCVWSATRRTLCRPASDDQVGRRQIVPLTLDSLWRLDLARISPQADRVYLAEAVLHEADYELLDSAGLRVVQKLPRAWAGDVVPRLAHHPCIVGFWDELCDKPTQSEPTPAVAELVGARPWWRGDALSVGSG
jgi:hypothetical protein